jgi:hypothetical protein
VTRGLGDGVVNRLVSLTREAANVVPGWDTMEVDDCISIAQSVSDSTCIVGDYAVQITVVIIIDVIP